MTEKVDPKFKEFKLLSGNFSSLLKGIPMVDHENKNSPLPPPHNGFRMYVFVKNDPQNLNITQISTPNLGSAENSTPERWHYFNTSYIRLKLLCDSWEWPNYVSYQSKNAGSKLERTS